MHLLISELKAPPVSAFTLVGEIDLASARDLQLAVSGAARAGVHRVSLDLADVTFMDMSGVRALAWCRRRMRLVQGELRISGSSHAVDRIMALASA